MLYIYTLDSIWDCSVFRAFTCYSLHDSFYNLEEFFLFQSNYFPDWFQGQDKIGNWFVRRLGGICGRPGSLPVWGETLSPQGHCHSGAKQPETRSHPTVGQRCKKKTGKKKNNNPGLTKSTSPVLEFSVKKRRVKPGQVQTHGGGGVLLLKQEFRLRLDLRLTCGSPDHTTAIQHKG